MGPKSKTAIVKAIGHLTDAVRALEVTRLSDERQRKEVIAALVENSRVVSELSAQIGEMVASHTRANAAIIELRRDLSIVEMRQDSREAE